MFTYVYRVKLISIGNPITVFGAHYDVNERSGVLTIYERIRQDGEWANVPTLNAAHGEWRWIRTIGHRDE